MNTPYYIIRVNIRKFIPLFLVVLRQIKEGFLVFVAKGGVCRNKNHGKHKHFLPIDTERPIFAVSNKKTIRVERLNSKTQDNNIEG